MTYNYGERNNYKKTSENIGYMYILDDGFTYRTNHCDVPMSKSKTKCSNFPFIFLTIYFYNIHELFLLVVRTIIAAATVKNNIILTKKHSASHAHRK